MLSFDQRLFGSAPPLSLDDGNDVPSINITLIKRNKMQKNIPSGLFLFGFVYALKVES